MQAAVFMGKESFQFRQLDMPVPGPGEIVVRNMVCGVCGTDVHIFQGEPGSAEVHPPVVLGHEYAGVVTAVGPDVTDLRAGDHVTVDPNIYCGKCAWCRSGKKQLCPEMQAIGVTRDGGFAQYSLVPRAQAYRLSPDLSFEAGAMAEPLACCLHGVDRAGIRPGQRVAVVGGGAIGLIMVQLAKLSGAGEILLSEPEAGRREVGLALGADAAVDPRDAAAAAPYADWADVVIECVGNNAAVGSAFRYAAKGAVIVLFSVPKPEAQYPLPLFDVYKKELTVRGSFVNPDTHARAVALLNAGKVDFSRIITHRFPLEKMTEAIAAQMSAESIKVVVCPQE